MHSSIGTGSLAYVVGSKIMDVRTYCKDNGRQEAEDEGRQASEDRNNINKLDGYCNGNNDHTDTTYTCQRESSSDSSDVSIRESIDSAAYDSSGLVPSPSKSNCSSLRPRKQAHVSQFPVDNFFDFPALPVTNLFENSEGEEARESHKDGYSIKWKSRFDEKSMHSFQIGNNEELIIESHDSPSESLRHFISSEIEAANDHVYKDREQSLQSSDILNYKNNVLNRLRISDLPETTEPYLSSCQGDGPSEDKVSEWLWTLHRIGDRNIKMSCSYFLVC